MPQQALVEALPDLPVGIAQAIAADAAPVSHVLDRQVAGLEQQRLGGDGVDLERRQQLVAAQHAVQLQRAHPAPEQRLHQEGRCAGLEPVRRERAAAEQQQDVERVVDPVVPRPVVAVVPVANPLPVQTRQLRSEHRVEVGLGIAADGGVARVHREVDEVVEAREHAHLRGFLMRGVPPRAPPRRAPADPGQEGEADVGVAGLDRPIEPAQIVPVPARDRGSLQRVQDRLVVLVHQHHDALPGPRVQRAKQLAEAFRGRVVARGNPGVFGGGGQLRHRAGMHVPGLAEVPGAEVEPHDGMPHRPVPSIVDVEPGEQRLAALGQLLEGVEEQALAEPPRARQEVVLALVQQPRDEAGLVDVVAVLLAELAEGLQADGQAAPGHHCRSA